jgi:hypothetical protein
VAAAILALPTSVTIASAATTTTTKVNPKTDISPVPVYGGSVGSGGQHGGEGGHLPARSENFELVSKLELTGRFGDITPEQIADVAVHKGFAYLNSWNEPTCQRGGTYIVDIREPDNPKEVGFVAAPARSIHGEGAHAVEYNGRDYLVVNNEPCTFAASGTGGPGGFDVIDITDPLNAVKLGAPGQPTGGDTGPDDGSLEGNEVPHSNHSNVMWEHNDRLYTISVDNLEFHDVDIHDLSDPANPEPVAEYDLLEEFPQIEDRGNIGSFSGTFHHDTKIKIIDDRVIVTTAYWDGGYVTYDLTDPQRPTYINDSSFDGSDPLTNLDPPEGNAHYSDFSFDNSYFVAADEDFTTHRAGSFDVEGVEYEAAGIGGGLPAAVLPDRVMNGPTVYGGYACDGSKPVPLRSNYDFTLEPGEEAILVLQRGPTQDTNNPEEACFPGQKAEKAWDAGWRNVLYINRHLGSADADEPFCGSGGYLAGKIPVSVCTTHEAGHDIFDRQPPAFGLPYDDETDLVPVGTEGDKVRATSQFDGWGYAHLYRNNAGKMERIDSWAVEESLDERFSSGFGDLSIHEHAPDPTRNVSYVAYYAAGARAITFGENGIQETGAFIDEGGNNFWGVEYFNSEVNGEPLIAFSDRDFGLYILRYTGPEAAPVAPSCAVEPANAFHNEAVTIRLGCTDVNGDEVTRSIVTPPANGTAVLDGDRAIYTPNSGFSGADSFVVRVSDGTLSRDVTVSVRVGAPTGAAVLGAGTLGAVSTRDATQPRVALLSRARQSLSTLRSGGLRFQLRFDEAVRLEVKLVGRLRGKQRRLATARMGNVGARQTVTVTLRPSASIRRQLRSVRRLSTTLRVRAVDASGNSSSRTKALSFR